MPGGIHYGDSTVKNKDDDKDGMWGWGSVITEIFNSKKVSVENCAMAGRSARTFLDEGRWDKVYDALKPGDFVLIQFGHMTEEISISEKPVVNYTVREMKVKSF